MLDGDEINQSEGLHCFDTEIIAGMTARSIKGAKCKARFTIEDDEVEQESTLVNIEAASSPKTEGKGLLPRVYADNQ